MVQKGSSNKSETRRIPFLILAAAGILYSLWRNFALFTDRLNLSNAIEFSSAIVDIVERFALLIFLLVVLSTFVLDKFLKKDDSRAETSPKKEFDRLFKFSWRFFVGVLFSALAIIILVNPRGLYGISVFPQLFDNIRQEKVSYYLDLPETPQLVIIGTSRTLSISPEYIEASLGYRTFNFGISGPQLDDSLLVANFIFDHSGSQKPNVILFELGRIYRIDPERTAQVSPLQFIQYMGPEMRVLAVKTRIQELFNIHQLSEALYVLQAVKNIETLPSYWTVTPNGFTNFQPPFTLEEDIDRYMTSGMAEFSCGDKNAMEGEAYLREFVSLAEDNDAAVIFYFSPLHPFFYQEYFGNNPKYAKCFNSMREFLLGLEAEHEYVFFEDFSDIESINGLRDEAGFFDRQHLTPLNAELLVDALADTIQQAFLIAAVKEE